MKYWIDYNIIRRFKLLLVFVIAITGITCNSKNEKLKTTQPLFSLLPSSQTNITFSNTLTEGLNTNVLMYEYFYNGGGVAIGDVNGDGRADLLEAIALEHGLHRILEQLP